MHPVLPFDTACLNMTTSDPDFASRIAFQGLPGAYSDLACRKYFPEMSPRATSAFEDTLDAVHNGEARLAMIPIENSLAGRVADIHRLMPGSGLHIVGERFLRVEHHLLALPGTRLDKIETVHSHVQALGQCGGFIRQHGLKPVTHADTAGAAFDVARSGDDSRAAIASELAGQEYGLVSLCANIEDQAHNTTRFLILSATPGEIPHPSDGVVITTFIFRVRNVPAALFKALGGFATNSVNMTKLESYMVHGEFVATQFYADIEGDPRDRNVAFALEELGFFAHEVKILGTYHADPFRFREETNA